MATAHHLGCAADASAACTPMHSLDRPLNHDAINPTASCPAGQAFIFPARFVTNPSPPPAPRPRRRPLSIADIQSQYPDTSSGTDLTRSHRPAALPQFSFNPGASVPANPESMAALSPPITPTSAPSIPSPSRPAGHGHRRGGSEFVGGSMRDGNSIAVMSSSPTRSEAEFASPPFHPPRRGHRRGVSGAISSTDLPAMYRQSEFLMPKGSSAPTTPTALISSEALPFSWANQSSAPLIPADSIHLSPSKHVEGEFVTDPTTVLISPPRFEPGPRYARPRRARVGFSETLEFIPRPLSLVSSDTSSTITARPGHSVSGSISSIVSAASPNDRETPVPLARTSTSESVDSRPSTAGAILERAGGIEDIGREATSPRRRNSIPTLLDMADSPLVGAGNHSPTKSSKRWSFFGLEPFVGHSHSSRYRSFSSSSSESLSKAVSGTSLSDQENGSSDSDGAGEDNNHVKEGRKSTSKKRRVQGWAGSILPLRSSKKRSKVLAVRPPTPPGSVGLLEDGTTDPGDEEEVKAADGNAGAAFPPVVYNADSQASETAGRPKCLSLEESACPMIDLDAALGPFNTPLPRNPEWDAAQRAAGNTANRRTLHSAQGMKGFTGPGMHYHRRAESAPDLPPFEIGRAGIHRLGSSSTMEDVFEEEEEEEGGVSKAVHRLRPAFRMPEIASRVDSEGESTPPATFSAADSIIINDDANGSASSLDSCRPRQESDYADLAAVSHAIRAECFSTSLQVEANIEEPPSIIYRSAAAFAGLPADQPDSAPSSPGLPLLFQHELLPVEEPQGSQEGPSLTVAMPGSPYPISHASSHPSPRSPVSVDAQRISTATSSFHDENSFYSLIMGEPGPELRISVDNDIPSLTSSNSEMTRDSAFVPSARMSQPSLREHRPVSVSSVAFGRRRSSLASISRLISSSQGERSKLSMEVTLDKDVEGKRSRSKESKTKRLSRMMQFWKPNKDGEAAKNGHDKTEELAMRSHDIEQSQSRQILR